MHNTYIMVRNRTMSSANTPNAKEMHSYIIFCMSRLKEILELKMKEAGFNMNSLSRKSGVEVTAIKHIIYGQTASPKIDTVAKLAVALKCSIDELYGNNQQFVQTMIPINNKLIWKHCIKIVDDLIDQSKKKIESEVRAELYLACYEFQLEGIDIDNENKLNTIIKLIEK